MATMLGIVVPPAVGLFAALRLGAQNHDWLRRFWFDYAALIACALVVTLFVSRAGAVAAALAAPPVGWQIASWIRALRRIEQPGKRVAAFAAVAMVLVPALPFTLIALATPATAAPQRAPVVVGDCDLAAAGPDLRDLGRAEVLAPLDVSSQLLYESRDLTVFATGHHRGNLAMRDTIALFLGSPQQAHRALVARGTGYVALCPGLNEPALYAAAAPSGFAAALVNDRVPAWLVPVEANSESGLKVWKIVR